MEKEELEIVEQAEAILNKESFRGYYDGADAAVFDEAVRWIEKAKILIQKSPCPKISD